MPGIIPNKHPHTFSLLSKNPLIKNNAIHVKTYSESMEQENTIINSFSYLKFYHTKVLF